MGASARSHWKLYDATGDESVRDLAAALIAEENDPKYRKKYGGEWKIPLPRGGTSTT